MESTDFEGLSEAGDVQRLALSMLQELNGAAKLIDGSYRSVELTNGFRDGDRPRIILASAHIEFRSRVTATGEVHRSDGTLVETAPESLTRGPAYLDVASLDANVRQVLKMLGSDFAGWMTLYKVYEVIRDDGDPASWATKAEYRAFTGSANHPVVSGPAGRHVRAPSSSPPKRTMTIDEARAFIQRVARAWISSK